MGKLHSMHCLFVRLWKYGHCTMHTNCYESNKQCCNSSGEVHPSSKKRLYTGGIFRGMGGSSLCFSYSFLAISTSLPNCRRAFMYLSHRSSSIPLICSNFSKVATAWQGCELQINSELQYEQLQQLGLTYCTKQPLLSRQTGGRILKLFCSSTPMRNPCAFCVKSSLEYPTESVIVI